MQVQTGLSTAMEEAFDDFMHRRGIRRTPERREVCRRAAAMPRHFMAEELVSELSQGLFRVSRATVFSTLNLMVEANVIIRHNFDNGSSRYEALPYAQQRHHHLVCRHCGKITEITLPELELSLKQRHWRGFTANYADVTVYGICSACNRESKRRKSKTKQS